MRLAICPRASAFFVDAYDGGLVETEAEIIARAIAEFKLEFTDRIVVYPDDVKIRSWGVPTMDTALYLCVRGAGGTPVLFRRK